MSRPYSFHGDWDARVVATAIHAGHDLRPEVAGQMVLPEVDRLREEDPHTGRLASVVGPHVVVHRSRFEVDLNRPREDAVYRTPADCWDLQVWRDTALPDDLVAGSLELYDAFHADLAERLDALAATGPFVLYDVHSYNHRRDGADSPASDPDENPEVNVGTGTLDHARFGGVVDAFITSLSAAQVPWGSLDVRENVRFKGGHLSTWVHERYPGVGCVLALEFRKSFMDEWTGEVDQARLDGLAAALAATVPPVEDALGREPR
ncbi:MAG: N-formylglutamate amidohydrolase [Propionibacteriaceae bacterium]|nr:N-formylglutamate amidohydrolase [Propionibacteriaceae bacterium]